MTRSSIIFTLEKVLMKQYKPNRLGIALLQKFKENGWQVYLQSEEKDIDELEWFIHRHSFNLDISPKGRKVKALRMWDKHYHFDLAVHNDFQTGVVPATMKHMINADFIIHL